MRARKNKGVTLTELLITVSLVGLIFLAAVVIQQTADKFYQSASIKSSVQTNAGYAMEKIVRSIRNSKAVSVSGGKLLTLTNPGTTPSTVEFGLRDLGNNNKAIYCKSSSEGEEILAKNVSDLVFLPENGSPVDGVISIILKVGVIKKVEGKEKKFKTIEI
ncbi:MAG: prepilin-type N-terminal cleavage/methylation domain-containing protein, partial [Candidatus Omnitrophica bacterium]|nr:prepilin-type N-terminal cleavage/methylation domain-containing protein [Candidatus Omnitrophota bacterium]